LRRQLHRCQTAASVKCPFADCFQSRRKSNRSQFSTPHKSHIVDTDYRVRFSLYQDSLGNRQNPRKRGIRIVIHHEGSSRFLSRSGYYRFIADNERNRIGRNRIEHVAHHTIITPGIGSFRRNDRIRRRFGILYGYFVFVPLEIQTIAFELRGKSYRFSRRNRHIFGLDFHRRSCRPVFRSRRKRFPRLRRHVYRKIPTVPTTVGQLTTRNSGPGVSPSIAITRFQPIRPIPLIPARLPIVLGIGTGPTVISIRRRKDYPILIRGKCYSVLSNGKIATLVNIVPKTRYSTSICGSRFGHNEKTRVGSGDCTRHRFAGSFTVPTKSPNQRRGFTLGIPLYDERGAIGPFARPVFDHVHRESSIGNRPRRYHLRLCRRVRTTLHKDLCR